MPQPEGHLPQVVKKKEGHMPELRKRRSHLALLGVFAMVASVLAVGAPSAVAEAGKVEGAATYSACVGPATVDAGFTDVATGSTHDAAVNCIAYYGITKGTTATTFAPNQTISRWQLAVMLQRAAGPAGVTLPDAKDMGFTDISGMSDAFQEAINQMAELGVMAGTTATSFDPSGIVSRATIVEALAGFLTNARVGPGGRALSSGVDRSLTLKENAAANADAITIDETFRDLGGVTYATHQAVRALAEMGVVQGRGDGTFGPAASVTRAQAAAFITRALAHTNARPAGLTMQSGINMMATTAVPTDADFDLSISLRGEDFAPIDSASIDIFRYATRNSGTAFKQDGTCNTGAGGVQGAGGGVAPCTVELDDDVTEPDGNVLVTPDQISEGTTFWAWSGDQGAKLDWDVTANVSMDNSAVSNAASVTLTTVTQPAKAMVSTSVSSDAEMGKTVRYGSTVTVTIQLADANNAPVGVAGRTFSWNATGEHDPVTSVLAGTGSRVVTTDSDGKASFTLTQSDPVTSPSAANNNNKTTWTYNIASVAPAGGTATTIDPNTAIGFTVASGTGTGSIIFDDDDPRTLAVSIELQRKWTRQPVQGGTARVGVTGKVTDQYGNPLRNQAIFFDLNGDGNFGCAVGPPVDCNTANTTIDANGKIEGTTRRVTRSNGTNTVSATWAGSGETIASRYRVGANFTGAANNGPDSDVGDAGEQDDEFHFWTLPPAGWNAETGTAAITTADSSDTGLGHGDLLVADLDNNTLVHISAWNNAGGARGGNSTYRDYTYTDSTIFKWFVGGLAADVDDDEDAAALDSNGNPLIRWLTATEFEARMAAHVKARGEGAINAGNLGAALGIAAYNTKSGQTIMSIRLVGNQGSSASARATANEALIRDPSPAG